MKGKSVMQKTVSLTENHLFRRLYRQGKSTVTAHLVVYAKKNHKRYNRLGITTTKKIGGAVQRNRARRVIHEAYRLMEGDIPSGLDIVIVARKKATCSKMQAVSYSLSKAFPRQ